MTARRDLNALRQKLLDATLAQAPFEGWTERALAAGARDAGIDRAAARRAFPGGVGDVLAFWSAACDGRMGDALAGRDLGAMRVRDRIAACVRLRIEPLAGHREAVRRALSRAAAPRHAPAAMGALWRTVDTMWRAAGDTATDFNFYSKRGLLAGVYAATLLYWLDDRSEGAAATWAFLDRRIAEVLMVPRALGRLRGCLPDPERLVRAFARRRPARG